MISVDNVPLNSRPSDTDFTVEKYRDLLVLANSSYTFSSYSKIPWEQRFVLWRHDCDCSLNRAYALARIEVEEGVRTTYFLNPHCEFYNLFEKSQHRLVQEILEMGHEIGLHFDAAFHDISGEEELVDRIRAEAGLLEGLFGVKPLVFSFHTPVASHLNYEAETYGGLVNCYSRRFKAEVPYCSDSDGYWRFRCLQDVLTEAADPCFQVLTHPEWWQEMEMSPRQRIFRSVYGRAAATMRLYDSWQEKPGRLNHTGAAAMLQFLKTVHPRFFGLCDYLWHAGHFQTLFVELWRLHEQQINQLCQAELHQQWKVPLAEINVFFENSVLAIDGWRLFIGVFGKTWQSVVNREQMGYSAWIELHDALVHRRVFVPQQRLEEGCMFLCSAIEALAAWGKAQPIHYDGINHFGPIGMTTCKVANDCFTDSLEEMSDENPDFSKKRWEQFKEDMQKVGAGEVVV